LSDLPITELFRKARKKMGLKQRRLADRLDVDPSSIRNYESGRRVPEPDIIWNFSNIAPVEFVEQLRRAVPESFRKAIERTGSELHELPPDINEALERLAKKHGLDTSVILLQALRTGLAALSRDASPDWKTLVKRQANIARRVEDREHPADSSRKHRRSKVA
jgi:transcriptional regulator with XRE-family HTH domain